MKAIAVKPATKEVVLLEDHPEPEITKPTEVKLEILEVGVCGTDKELVTFHYGTPPDGSDYLVIGHESLGRVVEVGKEVEDFKKGDLAVPMVRRPCPHPECTPCRSGRQDFCQTGDYVERGIKGRHGYMTERVVVDRPYLQPVPGQLGRTAVLTEPLTIAEKALEQLYDVQQRLPWGIHDHHAVVIGAGPVGLLGAMALIAEGFAVWVYSREAEGSDRAKLIESFGAHYVSSKTHDVKALREEVGRIDVVYEAAGAPAVAFDVMTVLGVNGVFLFTGVPGRKSPVEIETGTLMQQIVLSNQVVVGSVNAGLPAFDSAVRDLSYFKTRWPDQLATMLEHKYPIADFDTPLSGHGEGIKNVIVVNPEDA